MDDTTVGAILGGVVAAMGGGSVAWRKRRLSRVIEVVRRAVARQPLRELEHSTAGGAPYAPEQRRWAIRQRCLRDLRAAKLKAPPELDAIIATELGA